MPSPTASTARIWTVTVLPRRHRRRRRGLTLDGFLADLDVGRQLGDGRRMPEPPARHPGDLGQSQAQILQPPGNPHRPSLVPEVAFQLADDGVRGVGVELHLPCGSNRSTALTRPKAATWTRSSSGSPRWPKRPARYRASPNGRPPTPRGDRAGEHRPARSRQLPPRRRVRRIWRPDRR